MPRVAFPRRDRPTAAARAYMQRCDPAGARYGVASAVSRPARAGFFLIKKGTFLAGHQKNHKSKTRGGRLLSKPRARHRHGAGAQHIDAHARAARGADGRNPLLAAPALGLVV